MLVIFRAKAGLSIPFILPTSNVAPVNKAPEFPAEIKTSPLPSFSKLKPTTIEESFFLLIAFPYSNTYQ